MYALFEPMTRTSDTIPLRTSSNAQTSRRSSDGCYDAGSMPNVQPDRAIRELKIPLPPLATQQAIVAEIEAEQALVAANRELIARFEKKIQATLARVWGEDEPATGGG